jgi:hypothetical protein
MPKWRAGAKLSNNHANNFRFYSALYHLRYLICGAYQWHFFYNHWCNILPCMLSVSNPKTPHQITMTPEPFIFGILTVLGSYLLAVIAIRIQFKKDDKLSNFKPSNLKNYVSAYKKNGTANK